MIQQGPAPPEHCDQQARTYRQLQIAIHYRDGKGMHVLHVSAELLLPHLFVLIQKACTMYIANEGPVRIQYKCLVPIYVFPEMELYSLVISKTELKCSVFQFLHSYICERFIHFQDRSVYFAAAKYLDRSCEYINRSQTHEYRYWD